MVNVICGFEKYIRRKQIADGNINCMLDLGQKQHEEVKRAWVIGSKAIDLLFPPHNTIMLMAHIYVVESLY